MTARLHEPRVAGRVLELVEDRLVALRNRDQVAVALEHGRAPAESRDCHAAPDELDELEVRLVRRDDEAMAVLRAQLPQPHR